MINLYYIGRIFVYEDLVSHVEIIRNQKFQTENICFIIDEKEGFKSRPSDLYRDQTFSKYMNDQSIIFTNMNKDGLLMSDFLLSIEWYLFTLYPVRCFIQCESGALPRKSDISFRKNKINITANELN